MNIYEKSQKSGYCTYFPGISPFFSSISWVLPFSRWVSSTWEQQNTQNANSEARGKKNWRREKQKRKSREIEREKKNQHVNEAFIKGDRCSLRRWKNKAPAGWKEFTVFC